MITLGYALSSEEYSYHGTYFTVRDARIYTLPEKLPPIYIAASGPESAEMAAEISEGLISTTPGDKVVKAFLISSKARFTPFWRRRRW